MAGHAADHAHAQRIAEAAVDGYADAAVESGARGLQLGLERYGVPADADARAVASRYEADRGAGAAKRQSDLDCLTQAVYYEARGESSRGQAAVAQVVLNRVKHPAFPRTVCGVVYQGASRKGCQFSFACDGSMNRRREPVAWKRAKEVAQRALAGAARAEIGSATHFHTTAVSPAWAPQMLRVASVGAHVFYKFAPRGMRRAPAPGPEQVVLASAAAAMADAADLRVMPALAQEKAVETSLETKGGPDGKAGRKDDKPAKAAASEAPAKLTQASASKPASAGPAKPPQMTAQKPEPPTAAAPAGSDAAAVTAPPPAAATVS